MKTKLLEEHINENYNFMDKTIEQLLRIDTLRDLEIELKEAKLDGAIIPDLVFEIMKSLEDNYLKEKDL